MLVVLLSGTIGCMGEKLMHPEAIRAIEAKDPYSLIAVAEEELLLALKKGKYENLVHSIAAAKGATKFPEVYGEAHFILGYGQFFRGLIFNNAEMLIEKGISNYEHGVSIKPSLATSSMLPPLHYFVALEKLENSNDTAEAISLLQKAIRYNPEFIDSHIALSSAFLERDSRELALQEAKTAVELEPDNPEAQMQLGRVYTSFVHTKNESLIDSSVPRAIDAYKTVIRLSPDNKKAHEALAILYGFIGQYQLKAFALRSAMELGETPSLRYELGLTLFGQADLAGAEKQFRKSLDLAKNNSLGLRGLSYCQYLNEQYEQSHKTLSKLISRLGDPPSYVALWNFNSLRGQGRDDKGRAYLSKYYETFHGDEWEKALLEYHLGIISEQTLLSRTRQGFDRCEAYFYIACRYWHEGDRQAARRWFEKVMETKKYDYMEYYAANIRLAQLSGKSTD